VIAYNVQAIFIAANDSGEEVNSKMEVMNSGRSGGCHDANVAPS
jgi:hypothetical protein